MSLADPDQSHRLEEELSKAVSQEDLNRTKELLEQSKTIPFCKETAFITAVIKRLPEFVGLFLQSKVNLEHNNGEALTLAATNGLEDITKMLLKAGANPNANDNEAYQGAIHRLRPVTANLLIEAQPNVTSLQKLLSYPENSKILKRKIQINISTRLQKQARAAKAKEPTIEL